MAIQQGNTHDWVKSSYSANGACVELASPEQDAVAVRDSKAVDGPALRFPAQAWSGFVARVRDARPGCAAG